MPPSLDAPAGVPPYAHSPNIEGAWHRLEDHLRGTAELARQRGEKFGAGTLCEAAGLLHDVGKCSDEWQGYLHLRARGRPAARVDHKSVGALLFSKTALTPGQLALCGHHSGIPDASAPLTKALKQVDQRAQEALARLNPLLPELAETCSGPNLLPERWSSTAELEALELRVRMLHSALVDSDYLDTAAHFNAEPVAAAQVADFAAMNAQFLEQRRALIFARTPSPIDALREELFQQCLAAASEEPGIFRLPAPTGSGKTISSLAFALRHAQLFGKSRVVFAVPFLSITTQNAQVIRDLIGPENVIEHHSAIDLREKTKYGIDNWDSPVVITTTVQLFESLLSNRPSSARKLHNLIDAVIVIDEIQAIPMRVLPVILDVLRILVRYFGVTVLLSSATQPAWDQLSVWRDDNLLEVRDVVARPAALYAALRRTTTQWIEAADIFNLAQTISREETALVIVNTTAHSRDLARLLADQPNRRVLHLSTRMFAGHRRETLATARELLAAAQPFILVSTQLIEAGVDLDFPVVFREVAPAENLLQAAGRSNREGRLSSGRLVVFKCTEWPELRDYRTGIVKANQYFKAADRELDDPETMRAYYVDYFATWGVDGLPWAQGINSNRRRLRLKSVADEFRVIDDDSQTVVVGDAPGAEQTLAKLRALLDAGGVATTSRWRELQDYCVSLPSRVVNTLGAVEELPGVLVSRGCYDFLVGIVPSEEGPHDSVW